MTFLVGDEHGSGLHLQLGQLLVRLNWFTIIGQMPTSQFWSELQDLLLQFGDGIDAPHRHRNLRTVRAIEDIHGKASKSWGNWLLKLENGVGGVS